MLQSCQCERVAGKIDSALVKLMKSWKKKKILLGKNTGGKKKIIHLLHTRNVLSEPF